MNMIISEQSVLNNIHKIEASERTKLSLEAIVSLLRMVDISYLRLVELLQNSTILVPEKVIMEAWTIVGNLNRFRCILEKVSGVKKNNPWFQLISRQIKIVEPSRHFIEHYDGRLEVLLTEVKPLLGHLSWLESSDAKEVVVKLSIPGRVRLFKGLGVVNPAGKKLIDSIDQITLYLEDNGLNISELYYRLHNFVKGLEKYIAREYKFD